MLTPRCPALAIRQGRHSLLFSSLRCAFRSLPRCSQKSQTLGYKIQLQIWPLLLSLLFFFFFFLVEILLWDPASGNLRRRVRAGAGRPRPLSVSKNISLPRTMCLNRTTAPSSAFKTRGSNGENHESRDSIWVWDLMPENVWMYNILLLASKKAITKRWLAKDSPTIEDWLKVVQDIFVMEKLTFPLSLEQGRFEND